MSEMVTTEFENRCMEIIEQIVSIDVHQDRAGAIVVAEKMLAKAKSKTTNKNIISIYERVVEEFKLASDEEYLILKKQIFGIK